MFPNTLLVLAIHVAPFHTSALSRMRNYTVNTHTKEDDGTMTIVLVPSIVASPSCSRTITAMARWST